MSRFSFVPCTLQVCVHAVSNYKQQSYKEHVCENLRNEHWEGQI